MPLHILSDIHSLYVVDSICQVLRPNKSPTKMLPGEVLMTTIVFLSIRDFWWQNITSYVFSLENFSFLEEQPRNQNLQESRSKMRSVERKNR